MSRPPWLADAPPPRVTRAQEQEARLRAIRSLIRQRAANACECCGISLGRGGELHHRQRRLPIPASDTASNLVLLCAGPRSCHAGVTSASGAHRVWALSHGWVVLTTADPAATPVCHSRAGWCLLDDTGGLRLCEAPVGVQ